MRVINTIVLVTRALRGLGLTEMRQTGDNSADRAVSRTVRRLIASRLAQFGALRRIVDDFAECTKLLAVWCAPT